MGPVDGSDRRAGHLCLRIWYVSDSHVNPAAIAVIQNSGIQDGETIVPRASPRLATNWQVYDGMLGAATLAVCTQS